MTKKASQILDLNTRSTLLRELAERSPGHSTNVRSPFGARIGPLHAALLHSLGLSKAVTDYPTTVVALAEHVFHLQERLAALEAKIGD